MTIDELRTINRTIEEETLRYCQDMSPSLDEVGELTLMVAAKTKNMASDPHKINRTDWTDAVYNTIAHIL